MKKKNLYLTALLVAGCLMSGCKKEGGDDRYNGSYKEVAVVAHEYTEWTYFNFETGEQVKLPIEKKEGAVTGLYVGDLKGEGMFAGMVNMDSVTVVIDRVSADSVRVTAMDLTMSMDPSKPAEPFSLSVRAEAKLSAGVWHLSGGPSETLVGEGEQAKIYKFSIDGTIGTQKGEEVKLMCEIVPGSMPMPIQAVYTSKVMDSYTYATDAAEEAKLDWDIAVHKYDIRTNGGLVKKLAKNDMNAVTSADIPADNEMTGDIESTVIADMSNMMSGYVGMSNVMLNSELCGWVTATPTGSMPPYTYSLNDNVFLVKVGGKVWKMQFTAYNSLGKTAARFYYDEVK